MKRIKLLQVSADAEDDSELRILIDDREIKYLTIKPGVYKVEDICFEPAIISILPPLPSGAWVSGTIARDPGSGRPHFTQSDNLHLPGVTHTWHDHRIEYLQLSIGKKLRSNVYRAFDPKLNKHVIIKFARFSWEIPQIDIETRSYRWIRGRHIGPDFLGHITENGRVIGFIIEEVVDIHHASSKDLAECETVLTRLHKAHILHRDINRHNFLVGNDRAVLIDFDVATQCTDQHLLAVEFKSLKAELSNSSGRGGSSQAREVTPTT